MIDWVIGWMNCGANEADRMGVIGLNVASMISIQVIKTLIIFINWSIFASVNDAGVFNRLNWLNRPDWSVSCYCFWLLVTKAIMISTGLSKGSIWTMFCQMVLDDSECVKGPAWSDVLLNFDTGFACNV